MNITEMILCKVAEECNETAQRASKAMCFGLDEVQEGQGLTNAQRLVYEFNDIVAMMEILADNGLIQKPFFNQDMIELKKEKVEKWFQYSNDIGTLNTKP